MFKIILILAVIYIVLKVINTNAKLNEREARLAAEEEGRKAEAEAFEEDEMTRAEAVDVDPEVISNEAGGEAGAVAYAEEEVE